MLAINNWKSKLGGKIYKSSKNVKYLGIWELQNSDKGYLNKWKDIMYLDLKSHIGEMPILPKLFYGFNTIPIIMLTRSFVDKDKKLKVLWKSKWSRIKNFKKENQCWRIQTTLFKTYKATGVKIMLDWKKNRHRDPCNQTKNSETDPHNYGNWFLT